MSILRRKRTSEGASLSRIRFPRAGARKRRRALSIAGLLAACLLLPLGILQLGIYQENILVAQEVLPDAPAFDARERLFFLIPHCDDETLGAGGIIAEARRRGIAVKVVFLTNGDASLSMQLSQDARHLRRTSFRQMAAMRQKEAIVALKELGVPRRDIVFLGYPDGGTAHLWQANWTPHKLYKSPFTQNDHSPYNNSYTPRAPYCGSQVLQDMKTLMADFRPTRIFTTHPADTHPDHWAAYNFACAALESLRLGNNSSAWANRAQMLTFLVHRGLWPAPHGYHPTANLSPPAELKNIGTRWVQVELDAASRKAKAAALARYASQQATMPQFLNSFLRRNELLGIVPINSVLEMPANAPTANAPTANAPTANAPTDSRKAIVLLQDATRDSMVHDLWEAADIRLVSLQPKSKVMTLQIKLAHRASRKLVYRCSLHLVGAKATRAWTVDVRYSGSTFTALARENSVQAKWTARRVPAGVEIDVPRSALGLSQPVSRPKTLMVSATARLGARTLDQTETGTLRFLTRAPG